MKRIDDIDVNSVDGQIMKEIAEVTFADSKSLDTKRENANINCDTSMGLMLKYGTIVSKMFNTKYLMSEQSSKYHNNGDIHIHDLDFAALTETCCQIGLDTLLKDGFNTGHGFLREPNSITSYAALSAIAIQSNQNDMHGGQSVPNFDYDLGIGVAKSFVNNVCDVANLKYDIDASQIKSELTKYVRESTRIVNDAGLKLVEKLLVKTGLTLKQVEDVIEKSKRRTDRDTHQAMEAFIHNLNTMHSRAGSQVPFSSVNFGTDTSYEGRMVISNFLKATQEGLGNGETAIFPVSIFKLKAGVNFNPGDPNYDLFKMACKVSAKRLFPNFSNLDVPFNAQYYKEGHKETEIAYMGCVRGEETIEYMIGEERFKEGFRDAFIRVAKALKVENYGVSEFIDTSDKNITIMDSSSGGFVKCLKFIKNPNMRNWYKVVFSNGNTLTATEDHPLPVENKGRTFVKDMVIGDKVKVAGKVDAVTMLVYKQKIEYAGCSYDVETESDRFDVSGLRSHNCRTRVAGNVYDPTREIVTGRGNLSFTSVNLPRLGIKANKDINKFYKMLDEVMEVVHRQLLERLAVQSEKHVYNYPFLMGQGVWIDSDKLSGEDKIGEVIKHGTLTVGFIGIAETLIALTGKHHGESEESQKLGLEIVKHMREITDKWTKAEKLNYSLIATPAEGLSGRFVRMDRELFGEIKGITDKDYYTNSFHVPVYYGISAFNKIHIEAPYHALCNGGHITYIELDGDPLKNLDAFEAIVRCMHDEGVGYGAINHPVDRDPVCGYTGIIDDECPRCGRKEGQPMSMEKWLEINRRYCGVGNASNLGSCGNADEEADRVSNSAEGCGKTITRGDVPVEKL